MKINWSLTAIGFYLYRFSALSRAESVFKDRKPGTLMERRLFDLRYLCDVSHSRNKLYSCLAERFIPESKLIQGLLKPGMRIVDVGANVGYYMLMFAQKVGQDKWSYHCDRTISRKFTQSYKNSILSGMN